MQLTLFTDYALRTLTYLALQPIRVYRPLLRWPRSLISLEIMWSRSCISCVKGYIETVRGKHGGIRLASVRRSESRRCGLGYGECQLSAGLSAGRLSVKLGLSLSGHIAQSDACLSGCAWRILLWPIGVKDRSDVWPARTRYSDPNSSPICFVEWSSPCSSPWPVAAGAVVCLCMYPSDTVFTRWRQWELLARIAQARQVDLESQLTMLMAERQQQQEKAGATAVADGQTQWPS